ncbi:tolB protein precursor [Minicystis rosea]|nr:tolB protein precursor [Minicystis rosea]
MRRRSSLIGSLALTLAVAGYACGGGGNASTMGTGASGGSGGHANTGGNGASDAGDEGLFTNHGNVVSLTITPASDTIDVTNGAAASKQFHATATYEDTFVNPNADADWTFDRLELAQVDQNGKVTATGNLGGKGTLTAALGGVTATATVTVSLHVDQNPAGLDPVGQAAFNGPDGNPSGTMLYPYDRTVFARGLLAPELMWEGGAAGDAYLVHLSEANFDAKLYVKADPPSRFAIPQDVWTQLTQTNGGDDVQVDVLRLSGGQAHQAMHTTWTIAQGNLRGSIYYWAVNTGQLMKIAPGAASPVVVFDSGPADQIGTPPAADYPGTPSPPWSAVGENKRCVACHTVSKDGSTIAAIFEKTGSTASPWGTIDLAQTPASIVQMTPYTSQAIYLGLTPDGAYAVQNDVNMSMRLANAKTGAPVTSVLDTFTDKVADPAFSPDGKLLAFSGHATGSYPVEFTRGDLDLLDFDQASVAFSNRRTIVDGGSQAIAFPSFSPDSQWVFYQKGNYSRARYGAASELTGYNNLYVADVAKAVGEIELSAASGTTLESRNQQRSYQPTVNPISVGGYTWVVFVSPRDYGNRMRSATDATIENRKQLWVAAIDNNPQPGKDPSHPAFWLPGQDINTINMSGYWALEPCHQTGTSCDEGFECCTGFCQSDGMGALTCVPPPGGCSKIGDKCSTDDDCCGAPTAKCVGGFCAAGQPN